MENIKEEIIACCKEITDQAMFIKDEVESEENPSKSLLDDFINEIENKVLDIGKLIRSLD